MLNYNFNSKLISKFLNKQKINCVEKQKQNFPFLVKKENFF